VTYVGSANDPNQDQLLEEVLVGPLTVGVNRFILQAAAPNFNTIAIQDLIGVTVILITCSYLDEEFVRIGYYVNNEYCHPSYDPEGPLPSIVDIDYLSRNILAASPIVTRVNIDWSGNGAIEMPPDVGQLNYVDAEALVNGVHELVVEEDSMDVEQMQHQAARRIL
jgi:histone chaperone ASF1